MKHLHAGGCQQPSELNSAPMSGRTKLAGAMGVADLLEADLRKPLPKKHGPRPLREGGYPDPLPHTDPKEPTQPIQTQSLENFPTEPCGSTSSELRPMRGGYAAPPPSCLGGVRVPKAPAESRRAAPERPEPAKPDLAGVKVRSPASSSTAKSLEAAPSAQCTISDNQGPTEIRTKVFRIGAPLLRSTIPVNLGGKSKDHKDSKRNPKVEEDREGSDVETILSLSDGECDHEGQLSVTLDFPC